MSMYSLLSNVRLICKLSMTPFTNPECALQKQDEVKIPKTHLKLKQVEIYVSWVAKAKILDAKHRTRSD